jgi:integrase
MPTVHLTDRSLKSLRTSLPREMFWDSVLPGFGVRVTQNGRKTFVVRYRLNGKRPRVTIGSYPAFGLADARARARTILLQVGTGEDPSRAESFAELADLYLERHAKPKKRSWRYDERQLKRDLLPAWGKRKAAEIRRSDVHEVLDGILDRGSPAMANRTRALVSKVFNFGITRGIIEHNPVAHVPPPARLQSRQRVLSEEEVRELWTLLESDLLTPRMAASFKLRLLTAQRGVEVLSMQWDQIDGDWWTIPPDVAKNGLAHRVPLSSQAKVVVEEVRRLLGGTPWVFPSPREDGPIQWVQKASQQLRDNTSFEWTPHDLRRTAATFMASMGVSRLVIARILNHAETSVTAVYDRASYDREKQWALQLWGSRVETILHDDETPRVIARIG